MASQLNLTRSAILFHFDSKRTLLFAVLDELLTELDQMYAEFEQLPVPLTARKRRKPFTVTVDVLAAHPEATALLTRDLASVGPLRWPDGTLVMSVRMSHLLHGPDPDKTTKIRAAAAMGVFMRGMSTPPNIPLTPQSRLDAVERAQVVECALAAFSARADT